MVKTEEQLETIYSQVLRILVDNEVSVDEACYILKLVEVSLLRQEMEDVVKEYMLKHNR